MDGMLFVAFFFPVIVMFNFGLVLLSFLVSLYAGFGDLFHKFIEDNYGIYIPFTTSDPAATFSKRHPFFYPLLMNGISLVTVVGTYGLGKFYHSKSGWSFYQPLKGGLSFVILQIGTWTCLACAISFPWMTVDEVGVLGMTGLVDVATEDPRSHAGLMLIGSIFSILAQTFAFFSLIAFESDTVVRKLQNREELENTLNSLNNSNWNFKKVLGGDNKHFWWMFISLQICITAYAGVVAFLIDLAFLKDNLIQRIIVVTFGVLLTITISLTTTIGGKWKYGGKSYRLFMPWQGGKRYIGFQALGWSSFAAALVFTLFKLYDLSNVTNSNLQPMRIAGALGFFAELVLVSSLFVFDPSTTVDRSKKGDTKEEVDVDIAGSASEVESDVGGGKLRRRRRGRARSRSRGPAMKKNVNKANTKKLNVERIIGKRPSPKERGTIEYLVQWKYPACNTWENQPSLLAKSVGEKEFVLSCIQKYEEQLKDMVNSTIDDMSFAREIRKVKGAKGRKSLRSRSPPKRTLINEEESSEETEEEDMEGEMSDEYTVVKDSKGEIWEECEDEAGNIFYFSVNTGASVFHLPTGVTAR